MSIRDSSWWETEITRRSRAWSDQLILPVRILAGMVGAFAVLAIIIEKQVPRGGDLTIFNLAWHVSSELANKIVFAAALLPAIGALLIIIGLPRLADFWQKQTPNHLRYPDNALKIIEELQVLEEVKQNLRDMVAHELGVCYDPRRKEECKQAVKRLSNKLANKLART